jgi:hypothetical protein
LAAELASAVKQLCADARLLRSHFEVHLVEEVHADEAVKVLVVEVDHVDEETRDGDRWLKLCF